MTLEVAGIQVSPAITAPLDPGFLPASLFSRKYRELVATNAGVPLNLALERGDGDYLDVGLPEQVADVAPSLAPRAHERDVYLVAGRDVLRSAEHVRRDDRDRLIAHRALICEGHRRPEMNLVAGVQLDSPASPLFHRTAIGLHHVR